MSFFRKTIEFNSLGKHLTSSCARSNSAPLALSAHHFPLSTRAFLIFVARTTPRLKRRAPAAPTSPPPPAPLLSFLSYGSTMCFHAAQLAERRGEPSSTPSARCTFDCGPRVDLGIVFLSFLLLWTWLVIPVSFSFTPFHVV